MEEPIVETETNYASPQKRHQKAVPAISKLPTFSSISTPSIWEGEAPAQFSQFHQVENKIEDCELKIE